MQPKYYQAYCSDDATLQRGASRTVTFNVHITAGSTTARATDQGKVSTDNALASKSIKTVTMLLQISRK